MPLKPSDADNTITFAQQQKFMSFKMDTQAVPFQPSEATKSVTMAQFMRNVHSKNDLLYALQVKGKSAHLICLSYCLG